MYHINISHVMCPVWLTLQPRQSVYLLIWTKQIKIKNLLSLFAMPRYVSHRIENWPASGHGLEHQHGLWTDNSISNTEQPHQGTWRRWGHGQTWTRVRATCCCTRPGILQNWLVVVVKSAGSGSGETCQPNLWVHLQGSFEIWLMCEAPPP